MLPRIGILRENAAVCPSVFIQADNFSGNAWNSKVDRAHAFDCFEPRWQIPLSIALLAYMDLGWTSGHLLNLPMASWSYSTGSGAMQRQGRGPDFENTVRRGWVKRSRSHHYWPSVTIQNWRGLRHSISLEIQLSTVTVRLQSRQ